MNNKERNIERIKRLHITANVGDRTFHNGVEYVDLGLPSGTKWATMNVGAKSIEDGGLYFQWGDTQGYTNQDVINGNKAFYNFDYKYGCDYITKYNSEDRKTVLYLEDDAAHVHLGGSWRMPTREEIYELINYTFQISRIVNGVTGLVFQSKKDVSKWIFIPYCGNATLNSIHRQAIRGFIWSSTTSRFGCHYAYALCADPIHMKNTTFYRYKGFQVRGVF